MGSASLNYKLTHALRIKTQWNFISAENHRDSEENLTKLLSKTFNLKVSDYRFESWRLHVKFVSVWSCNFDINTCQFPSAIEAKLVSISIQTQTEKTHLVIYSATILHIRKGIILYARKMRK